MTSDRVKLSFKKLKKQAKKNGWTIPVNDAFPEESWINYWEACASYANNPEQGRPVPPHRSA